MPVIVVGAEKTMTQLRTRLVEGRLSKAANERFIAAIRKANPGVNLDRLKPGTVLTIPRLVDVKLRPKIGVLADSNKRTGELVTEVKKAITDLDQAAAGQAKVRQAQRVATARTLRSKALEAQTKRNPQLRANIKDATETLAAQERSDKQVASQLKSATAAWANDLAKLQELGDLGLSEQ